MSGTRVAVLFDNNTAIAKAGNYCFNLYRPAGPKGLINIGRTALFFAALIAQDLVTGFESEENSNIKFGYDCCLGLQCAYDWSMNASIAWTKQDIYFYGDYTKALSSLKKNKLPGTGNDSYPYCGEYRALWESWNKSSVNLGLVSRGEEKEEVFQLWRGEGALKGLISVGGLKRSSINDLLTKINQYCRSAEVKRPYNCLLLSSPGWGKSFLARCLARHFNMTFLDFSLSQMSTTSDLIDCFDAICSTQNRSDKKLLVFLDEINSEIEGNSAMGLLLSPIWDGGFISRGKFYRLEPAVWVFASSGSMAELAASNKGSDFVSRLNGPIIDLNPTVAEKSRDYDEPLLNLIRTLKGRLIENDKIPDKTITPSTDQLIKRALKVNGVFRTEQVYLGVSLLNSMWGPISAVQKGVLRLFHDLLPINGFRSLEFFVSKFWGIQRGVVLCSNVPSLDLFKELRRHVILPSIQRDTKMKTKKVDDLSKLIAIETGILNQ